MKTSKKEALRVKRMNATLAEGNKRRDAALAACKGQTITVTARKVRGVWRIQSMKGN